MSDDSAYERLFPYKYADERFSGISMNYSMLFCLNKVLLCITLVIIIIIEMQTHVYAHASGLSFHENARQFIDIWVDSFRTSIMYTKCICQLCSELKHIENFSVRARISRLFSATYRKFAGSFALCSKRVYIVQFQLTNKSKQIERRRGTQWHLHHCDFRYFVANFIRIKHAILHLASNLSLPNDSILHFWFQSQVVSVSQSN